MCAPSGLALGSVRYFVLLVPPKVVGCTQITSDGLAKGFMVTDGVRLYFSEVSGGHYVLSQVSTAGGETVEIPTPFRNIMVQNFSKDHSQLLVAAAEGSSSLPLLPGCPTASNSRTPGAPHSIWRTPTAAIRGLWLRSRDSRYIRAFPLMDSASASPSASRTELRQRFGKCAPTARISIRCSLDA
jgi:hypothetical protein